MVWSSSPSRDENGFILVTVMMIMLILTVIGIMSTNTSDVELKISGNDKVHKQTFYQADGGTELAERLVFENAVCSSTKNGFTQTGGVTTIGGNILVFDSTFAATQPVSPTVTDTNRAAVYYPDGIVSDANPHTNFLSQFTTGMNAGAGQQMISGYEGLGAGAAGGGTNRSYLISTQHYGLVNSLTRLMTQWRLDTFIIASAASSDCKY